MKKNIKISMDYDGTLSLPSVEVFAKELVDKGYEVWIHENNNKPFKIILGSCKETNRLLKKEHNLFKLWQSGEFNKGE